MPQHNQLSKYPYIHGSFLKCWVSPTTLDFPTQNDQHLGCVLWGETHHLRNHPHKCSAFKDDLQKIISKNQNCKKDLRACHPWNLWSAPGWQAKKETSPNIFPLVVPKIAGWNIPIFNRKHIFIPGSFPSAMLFYQSVVFFSPGERNLPLASRLPTDKSQTSCLENTKNILTYFSSWRIIQKA